MGATLDIGPLDERMSRSLLNFGGDPDSDF